MTHSVALNITLVTYDKHVDFGIVACRSTVPQTQRMIDYMEESLQALEVAAGIAAPARKRKVVTRKSATQRKAAVKRKATAKSKLEKSRPVSRKTPPKSAPRRRTVTAKVVKPKMAGQ